MGQEDTELILPVSQPWLRLGEPFACQMEQLSAVFPLGSELLLLDRCVGEERAFLSHPPLPSPMSSREELPPTCHPAYVHSRLLGSSPSATDRHGMLSHSPFLTFNIEQAG